MGGIFRGKVTIFGSQIMVDMIFLPGLFLPVISQKETGVKITMEVIQ